LDKYLATVPSNDRPFLRKLVNGDSVGEFVTDWDIRPAYLVYDEKYLTAPREPSVFEQEEKLILMAKPKYLKASLDREQIFVTNDTYVARWQNTPEYKPNIKYLLGVMNSKVLDLYYKIRHSEYVRGGWFVRYGIFFDELPIKKASLAEEAMIISIVDKLLEARTKVKEAEKAAFSTTSAITNAGVETTTAGLSTIIDLKTRKGGDEITDKLHLRGKVIFFNRSKTASIQCSSENAARLVFALLDERFENLKNRTLAEVMTLLRLPNNDKELHKLEQYLKTEEKATRRLSKKIKLLKEQLEEKVAEMYGLHDQIHIIKSALAIIGGEIQDALSSTTDSTLQSPGKEKISSQTITWSKTVFFPT
jgi:hypothetical protein